jgi:hypothetical protein
LSSTPNTGLRHAGQPDYHLGGAQLGEAFTARSGADRRDHVRSGPGRQLHPKPSNPAGGTGDHHPTADDRTERAQGLQGGDPRHWQRRRLPEVDRIRKYCKVFRGYGAPLRPPACSVESDDPAAHRWAGAVGRGLHDHARGIPTRNLPGLTHPIYPVHLAEVQRRRVHFDQRLGFGGHRLVDVGNSQIRACLWIIDDCSHATSQPE